MSVIFNKLIENIDYCWYDSSNILYSECDDKKDELKDVKVVFKGGRTYLYKKVNVQDYLKFRNNISQGKALRQYLDVKTENGNKKYEFIRIEDTDINELEERKKKLMETDNVQETDSEVKYIFIETPHIAGLYKDGKLLVTALNRSGITAAGLLDAINENYRVTRIDTDSTVLPEKLDELIK
jgi:hypothetical protein